MEKIEIQLEVYQGPLDLLLHLIKTLEVDIYDIPIAEVTKQYMNVIETMKELELEIAGEYIVMASTLMAIKSKMLLPIETYEGEDSEYLEDEHNALDPREQLVAQLLEYQKYKNAALLLQEKEEERAQYFTKEASNLSDFASNRELPINQYNTIDLFLGFHQMLEKRRQRQPLKTAIKAEKVSIEERMDEILTKLTKFKEKLAVSKKGVRFEEILDEEASRSEIITTFMAVLELMKKQQIIIQQAETFGEIYITANFEAIDLVGVTEIEEQ